MPTPVGTHIFLNVYDVPTYLLTTLEYGKPLCDNIVMNMDLHVVGEVVHQFQPHGYTLLYLLSESHFSIHTYPEYQSCYIDIFCCNPSFGTKKAVDLVCQLFQTDHVDYHVMKR
jgi:S-adenosylmethionine decarboxylase proenzyme